MRLASKKSSRDLTDGNIFLLILTYSAPILLGQLFQHMYNSVDSIVVGQFVGITALAAVSCCTDISRLIVGFFTGLSTGGGILFARLFGQKNYTDLKTAIHTGFTFALLMGGFMAVLGVIITPLLLKAVACPPDVWPEAMTYLRIYLIGVFFTSIYNVLAGVLRAVGDSRSPFIFLVIASVTNIVLDLFFVAFLRMGVSGVAIATIISQATSCYLILFKMTRTEDVYHLSLNELSIDKKMLADVLKYGLPAAVQMCITSFSNLFVQRYLNQFGTAAIAGAGAAKKTDAYIGMIPQSIGLSMATFTSQNLGARKYTRVFRGINTGIAFSCALVLVANCIVLPFSEVCIRLFTSDPGAIYYGAQMLRIMVPFYVVMSVHSVISNAIRGLGRSTTAMVLSITGMVVCRQIFLAISMSFSHVVQNVFWSYPLGWCFASALELIFFAWISRTYRKLGDGECPPARLPRHCPSH